MEQSDTIKGMNRASILLLFGGESSEHDVSVSSARNVYAAIDNTKFHVELGYIDKAGKWWLLETLGQEIELHGAPQLAPVLGSGSFVTFPTSRVVKPDVIFPILHGKNGEDGSVQGLAQLMHIPIVGCDVTASSICMDKVATKEILASNGINVVAYETHRIDQPIPDFDKLNLILGSPLFVKPAKAGSSVGVSKVHTEEELIQALRLAHEHDAVALIERGVSGRELEVAILGNVPQHEASPVGEIQPDGEFYSYDAKYATTSESKVIIPAQLTDETSESIRAIALQAYETLGCRGLARVDFFLAADDTLYLNEVNTLPGFTNISMYPKLWRQVGVSYSDLISRLINDAINFTQKPSEQI